MNRPLLALSLLAGLASVSLAQPAANPPSAPSAPPALRGPDVRDHHVPGTDGSFGGSTMPRGAKAMLPTPRIFMQAVRESLGPDAPESLRATPEQIEQLERIGKDAARELRAEPRRDREGAPVPAKPAKGAPQDDRPPRRENRSADAPLPPPPPDAMEMEAMTPEQRQSRAGAHFARAWEVLRPEQREAVELRMEQLRDQQFRSNEEDRARRDVRKKLAEQDAKPDRAPRAKDAALPLAPQRRERLLALFARLSPEQQDRVLERLEGLANGAEGPRPAPDARPERRPDVSSRSRPADDQNAPAPRPRPDRKESKNRARGGESVDKPAPNFDDIKVPPPETSDGF